MVSFMFGQGGPGQVHQEDSTPNPVWTRKFAWLPTKSVVGRKWIWLRDAYYHRPSDRWMGDRHAKTQWMTSEEYVVHLLTQE